LRDPVQPKVLIVDDSRDFVEYTSRRLRVRGMKVLTAFTGEAALKVIRQEPIDIVLLDILMPGMDGIETLRKIKQIAPTIEVVMMTGHGTNDTAEQGKELGAQAYLLKPMDFNALLVAIGNASREGAEADRNDGDRGRAEDGEAV
jgi:DNA-binding response OmpR family regulator